MDLTYITGCSGSGKADLAAELTDAGAHVVLLNDHPSGMPQAGHVEWLRWVAAEYLAEAAADRVQEADGRLYVVGTMWPFQLIETPSWRELSEKVDVRFVVLDRPWDEIAGELRDRLEAEPDADPDEVDEQIENDRRLQRQLVWQAKALAAGAVLTAAEVLASV